ncbi:MAG: hypothetical protein BWX80_03063 [Candidatus Hydrogenedentes bacterium ADurb.Bin101]|nr:MAG: hypothetical protein BWX80_03063 [Candidatus Hydrogenedentes bacterium ADurb.Bin101]
MRVLKQEKSCSSAIHISEPAAALHSSYLPDTDGNFTSYAHFQALLPEKEPLRCVIRMCCFVSFPFVRPLSFPSSHVHRDATHPHRKDIYSIPLRMVYLSFTESFLCRRQSGLQTGILFRLVEKEKADIMFNLRIFSGLTDNHAPIFFLPIFKNRTNNFNKLSDIC